MQLLYRTSMTTRSDEGTWKRVDHGTISGVGGPGVFVRCDLSLAGRNQLIQRRGGGSQAAPAAGDEHQPGYGGGGDEKKGPAEPRIGGGAAQRQGQDGHGESAGQVLRGGQQRA